MDNSKIKNLLDLLQDIRDSIQTMRLEEFTYYDLDTFYMDLDYAIELLMKDLLNNNNNKLSISDVTETLTEV